MTRTLLVDCYPDDWKDKLRFYLDLLSEFSHIDAIDQRKLGPESSAAGFDSVVVTGSPMMLTDREPPKQLSEFVRGLEVPTLGICFGHQLLGAVTGARVGTRAMLDDWETVRILRPAGLFEGMGSKVRVLESHREFLSADSVAAAGWQVLADSGSCPVEAMRHLERPLYGVQFHPERSGENGRRVVGNFYRHVVSAKR
ncbi:MAG: gamma-glutamyl-gamma-aminobutyrate hydrolase family protein [candidate division WOR-3 bacterium]|nr:MAG: gamma-glutamyl-gamma-aminobutyrate hydrolase family protein [candidate division WOR-3 bacterium]